jgi:hypothetical protein
METTLRTPRKLFLFVLMAEIVLLALVGLFPGGGHSPLLYLQIPALFVVARLAPEAGSCISCAPAAWAVGALTEVTVVWGILAVLTTLLRRHSDRAV